MRGIFFLLILMLGIGAFPNGLQADGVDGESHEKTNEEKIRQNLEVLERLEMPRSEGTSGKTSERRGKKSASTEKDDSGGTQDEIRRLMGKIENEDSEAPRMVIERTSEGVRISIRNIRFESDSAVLLESERGRLDEIAQILRTVPSSKIIVDGHTASVGDKAGERLLSVERARKVASELSERGVPESKFECRGFGGVRERSIDICSMP